MKFVVSIWIAFFLFSCKDGISESDTPPHYDINHPEITRMPRELTEISGHAFYKGNSDTLYAEQDEKGAVYQLVLGTDYIRESVFRKKGDFEDIAILNETVIMLRSDGTLFSFPFSELGKKKIESYTTRKDLLPPGEYEGLYADNQTNQVFVLCKDCKVDRGTKEHTGYIFNLKDGKELKKAGDFKIDLKEIEKKMGKKHLTFHPSAFAFNELTKEWFIVSSVNSALVVTDSDWTVKEVYTLKKSIYLQPEGIAFDNKHNLFLSSEGSGHRKGEVYKIPYRE